MPASRAFVVVKDQADGPLLVYCAKSDYRVPGWLTIEEAAASYGSEVVGYANRADAAYIAREHGARVLTARTAGVL